MRYWLVKTWEAVAFLAFFFFLGHMFEHWWWPEDGSAQAGPPQPTAQIAPQAPTESPDLVAAIKSEEGFRATPYDDSEGVLTIGYGLNLTGGITRAEADYLLRSRIDHAVQCLERGLSWFVALPQRVEDALTDMTFQLGCAGVMQFTTMLGQLEAGEWAAAREDALRSRWAMQTPERAERVTSRFLP